MIPVVCRTGQIAVSHRELPPAKAPVEKWSSPLKATVRTAMLQAASRIVKSPQVLSEILKRKQIYSYFSRSAMEKAHTYHAQGRVSAVDISDDLTHVSSQVRGSEGKNYRVDIQLEFDGDQLTDLDGDCSCPMGFNCNHVAATLLDVLSDKKPSGLASVSPASAAKPLKTQAPSAPPVLGFDVSSWIDNVGRAARNSDSAADESQRLLYCLNGSDAPQPCLTLSLRSVRLRKGGDYADNYTSPSLYEFRPERAPKYFRDIDVDIVTEISGRIRSNNYIQGTYPEELLRRIGGRGTGRRRSASGAAVEARASRWQLLLLRPQQERTVRSRRRRQPLVPLRRVRHRSEPASEPAGTVSGRAGLCDHAPPGEGKASA